MLKLRFVQEVVEGERYLRLTQIKALSVDRLPKAYVEGAPAVYADSEAPGTLIIVTKDEIATALNVGDKYKPESVNAVLKVVTSAGSRLKRINDYTRKHGDGWTGKMRVFKI